MVVQIIMLQKHLHTFMHSHDESGGSAQVSYMTIMI
jgi:hypothetical protein